MYKKKMTLGLDKADMPWNQPTNQPINEDFIYIYIIFSGWEEQTMWNVPKNVWYIQRSVF